MFDIKKFLDGITNLGPKKTEEYRPSPLLPQSEIDVINAVEADKEQQMFEDGMTRYNQELEALKPARDPFAPPKDMLASLTKTDEPKSSGTFKSSSFSAPTIKAPKVEESDYEKQMRERLAKLEGMEAPTLEEDPTYLARLKEAQDEEAKHKMFDAVLRGTYTIGNAIASRGMNKANYDILAPSEELTGLSKRQLQEAETERAKIAGKRFEAAKTAADFKRAQAKDGIDIIDGLEKNRQNIIMLEDRLANSASERQGKALENQLVKLKLDTAKQEQAMANDPNSVMSQAARKFYARKAAEAGYADLAPMLEDPKLTQTQLENLMGKMNMENMVSQFRATEARKELAAQEAEAKKESDKAKMEVRVDSKIDSIRKGELNKFTNEYYKMQDSIKDLTFAGDSKSGAGDMVILYRMISSLDPESVVREGEIDLAKATAGQIDKFVGIPRKITKGTILAPDQRKELVKVAQLVAQRGMQRNATLAMPSIRSALKQGEAAGMDREEIVQRLVPLEFKNVVLETINREDKKEAAIDAFMQKNNISSRAEAIKILREAGKL